MSARGFNDEELAIARLYARCTLQLAREKGEGERVLEDLDELEELLDAVPESQALLSPLVKPESRRRVIDRALRGRLSDLLVDALQVMSRKGRFGLARAFIEAYRREHEKALGRVEVHVATARPLDEPERERLRRTAARVLGKEVRITEELDESLLGGVMVHAGDWKFDATVRKELENLGRRLRERASEEIHAGNVHLAGAE